MNSLTILHISDLHYCKRKNEQSKALISGLLQDLSRVDRDLGLKPDLVFFTGDLVQKGDDSKELFQWVSGNVVDPILDLLNLTSERFFCVPGNHEIARSKVYEELETGLSARLNSPEAFEEYFERIDIESKGYLAIVEKLEAYSEFENAYRKDTLIDKNHFYSGYKIDINGLSVGIGCFNSAWRSSQYGIDKGRLILGRTLVERLGVSLEDADIKLALCHHPFDWLAEWDEKQVRRRIGRHFNLLFNGHVHDSDPTFFQQSFGAFYTSTAGCMKEGDHFSHYSIIKIDVADSTLTAYLRKWYPDRGTFDQETEKAENGAVRFTDFRTSNPEVTERLQLHKYRQKIGEGIEEVQLVNPWEGIVELTLNDVFVEPVICDTSSLNRSESDPNILALPNLLSGKDNLFFFGRQESGKTLLMQHIEAHLLQEKPEFEQSLPVLCKFSDLPRNNPKKIIGIICSALDNEIDSTEAIGLLEKGRVILLVDDLGDKNNPDCTKRSKTLIAFLKEYPKTRIVATIQEQINQQMHSDVITLQGDINARPVYVWPFTTAKLKQLLTNISRTRSIDVNKMLEQIVFYFHHLQIPVTPLAATLFIGVLFRDPKQRNIQNEAYLIENYLESILEKLDNGGGVSVLDFREKESFLAYVAWAMVSRNSTSIELIEFERLKLAYFEKLEEELPPKKVFDDFFKKGILMISSGKVSFKFRFWYYFFIAKSIEKSGVRQGEILGRSDYLSFSTAIAYKAGLVRNDLDLLKTLAARLDAEIAKVETVTGIEASQTLRIEEQLEVSGKAITDKISAKLSDGTFEEVSDLRFSLAGSNDVTVQASDDPRDTLGELLTLHADVLRNTREIDGDEKYEEVIRSVEGFLSLMWGVIRGVGDLVTDLSEKDLERLFFQKMIEGNQKERLTKMLLASQRMVFQMVPVSFAFYMCDHLCNPKLASVMERCAAQAKTDGERLFYYFLLFKCNPEMGYSKLREFAKKAARGPGDLIASLFLRVYGYETPLDQNGVDKLVELLAEFRKKTVSYVKDSPIHLSDTYRETMRRNITIAQQKKGSYVRKRNSNKRRRR